MEQIDWQEQILIGTVLGGSSLVKPPKGKNYYLSMRSQNKDWLMYKMVELTKYFKSPEVRLYGRSMRCNSSCSTRLTEMRERLYEGDRRIVGMETLDMLRDVSLAIWWLDGGGKTGRAKKNAYFHTTKFGMAGSETICEFFNSLGMICSIGKNGSRLRLLFSVAGTTKLFKTIAGRFPPFMYHRL